MFWGGRSETGSLHATFPQRNATGQGAASARDVPVRCEKSGFPRGSNLEEPVPVSTGPLRAEDIPAKTPTFWEGLKNRRW